MNKEEKVLAIKKAIDILNSSYSLDDLGKPWMSRLLHGMGDIRVAKQMLEKQ